MRVRVLCTVKRGGVYHPPGTPLDLEDHEIKALRGRVEVITDLDEAPDDLPGLEGPGGALTASDAPPVDPAALANQSDPSAPASGPAGGSEGSGTESPGGSEGQGEEEGGRVGAIARTIDTLDEGDFTQAGRPKVDALEAALGYRPSKDEVDAAIALRDSLAG